MVSDESTRKMVKELRTAGWLPVRTDGSHTVYRCSCGEHQLTVPDGHRVQSPGLVRKIRAAIATCKEGK